MFSIVGKIIFTVLSLSLLIGNTTVCIGGHAEATGLSYSHFTEVHCASTDICNDKHPTHEDITLDLEATNNPERQIIKVLALCRDRSEIEFPIQGGYLTKLKTNSPQFVQTILRQLSTVILTT